MPEQHQYEFRRPNGTPVYVVTYTYKPSKRELDGAVDYATDMWGVGSTLVAVNR